MLKNGTYAAWFKTPLGQGTAIAHVADGKIWGRDSVMTCSGSCEIDGDRFTAVITTKRPTDGQPTVFGNEDELRLKLEGTCIGKIASYTGTAEQFPGVLLEGTLIFSEQQSPAPERDEPVRKFDPSKFPKLPCPERQPCGANKSSFRSRL
ncbi:hypothetical protein SAMN05216338_108013 [Bradyrhizobium sp. Rc2d]|uniref:hypothetical protein n=1 Tax=Bradyrhizobium sp. Rc2d TaxID=1855321 RepID=UPI00088AD0E6|nr:hypothetical protein [Bradyrhizobium sp. Rc2d]SDK01522.1 hypothetical protein SAMN05216338_108013 [Bradyrhizobium sp. Rc2d]